MEVISRNSVSAPEFPGVYKMIDGLGNVLYVGKAKNIKKRIVQYLRPSNDRILTMLSQVEQIDFLTTTNEIEALVVEAKLIRSLQPKYNILLKDDKSYPYVLITNNHEFPRIIQYRGIRQKNCYGPFTSKIDLQQNIIAIQKAFKIRPCSDTFFKSRKKPCLEYQIKRCSAPCVGKISQNEYSQLVKQAKSFLSGKGLTLQNELRSAMEKASANQQYELAMVYRDRIAAIKNINIINFDDNEEADYISIYGEENEFCIDIISFDKNKRFGNYRYFLKGIEEETDADILSLFLRQFCIEKSSKNIYLNIEIEDNHKKAIETILGHKIYISTPKQGIKLKIIDWVYHNAKLALKEKIKNYYNTKEKLKKLQDIFYMQKPPKRIEIYDNSHIFGEFAIGVMVVFTNKGFEKKEYRCFKIKEAKKSDDYGMMKEVLSRRFHKKNTTNLPDLVLIDGGLGHLSSCDSIPPHINFACIAKGVKRNAGDETFFLPEGNSFKVEDKKILHFLQIMRDEAHRFAIKSHRNLRQKSISKSILDDIPGIGKARKNALLQKFGSIEAIKAATIEDLTKIRGITNKIALNIFNTLHII